MTGNRAPTYSETREHYFPKFTLLVNHPLLQYGCHHHIVRAYEEHRADDSTSVNISTKIPSDLAISVDPIAREQVAAMGRAMLPLPTGLNLVTTLSVLVLYLLQ